MCNNYEKNFKDYYYKYLNYNEVESIISSKNREKSINAFYYPIIVSLFDNKIIYSIDPKYFEELKIKLENKNLRTKDEIIEFLKEFFKIKDENVSIQEMLRMTKIEKTDIDISEVINIGEKNKKEYFNSFEHCNDLKYKEMKWEKVKKYKYISGIIKDNKIVSVGFISNIDYKGANIVIETKELYKNNGYGKSIVEKISRDLLIDSIIPIYWVNIENKASIKLAKDIEFKEQITEIVVKMKEK